MADATIRLRVSSDLAALNRAEQAFNALSRAEQKAARESLALARDLARADAAFGDAAGGANRLRNALQTIPSSARGIAQVEGQIASLESKASKAGKTFATDFGDSIKSSLLGVVGPAAIAGTALAAVQKTTESFAKAFLFKADLDATNRAIEIQLRGVRDSGVAFAQAAQFGQQFGFTQQETNAALLSSVSILRQSTSGADELLGVLGRLQVVSPEQTLSEAALALKELQSGDTQSLRERFEIGLTAANKMKEEIKGGADAVQVLSRYLDGAGVSMDTLKNRAEGATGAINDLKRAQEDLRKAQGEAATGPGIGVAQTGAAGLRAGASVLQGEYEPAVNQAAEATARLGILLDPIARLFGANNSQITLAAANLANWTDGTTQATVAQREAIYAANEHALETGRASGAYVNAADAARDAAAATREAAEATIRDAQEKELLASKTELLKTQIQLAADEFIRLNPNMSATEAAGAAARAGFDAVTQGAIVSQVEIAKARVEIQRLLGIAAAQEAGRGGKVDTGNAAANNQLLARANRGGRITSARARSAAIEDEQALRQAQEDRINRTGSATEKLTLAQQKQNDLIRKYGKDSTQAYEAGTAVIDAQQAVQAEIERNAKKGGSAAAKGLSTLDRADIKLAGDYQNQLDEVNRRLQAGSMTELQRKQLLIQKQSLEEKIANAQLRGATSAERTADAIERQAQAANAAKLAEIDDQRERLDEAKRVDAARRVLASTDFGADEKARAQLAIAEVPLLQEKRALDIAQKAREGGIAIPLGAAGAGAPLGATPAGAATQGVAASDEKVLIMQVDGRELGRIAARFLNSGRQPVQAVG
jgi:hypothetical protein